MYATFSTHPLMVYVVKSTNYESHRYTVCLPSCHFLPCLSVLHYTTHFTSLICRHFSQFMYFVCKRVYTSCEALTVMLLGIQVFQDVTQRCLDLLLHKYLHCGEHAAQIMHNIRWACYSVTSVFHKSNMTTTRNNLLCLYSSVHDMWVPLTMAWSVLRLQMEERTSRYGH